MKDRDQQLAILTRELQQLDIERTLRAREYKTLMDKKRTEISKLVTEILQGKESLFGSGNATIDADDSGNVQINIPAGEA